MDIEKLVPNPDDVEDIALDYVELGLGRFYFPQNWDELQNKVEHVRKWMRSVGDDPALAEEVVAKVDALRKSEQRWRLP